MSTILKSFGKRYHDHMIHIGRNRSRVILLGHSDRTLQDLGISRALLEKGTQHWPWTPDDNQPALAPAARPNASKKEETKAIRELRALTNRELLDIGITRSEIVYAVRHGRPGIGVKSASSEVLDNLTTRNIGAAIVGLDQTPASNLSNNPPMPTGPSSSSDKTEAKPEAA